MAAKDFRDLRAWQAARAFKVGVYDLTRSGALAKDERLRSQLCEAAASAASHISEGFGRFDPLDFARFVRMGRASLLECVNHLIDAVDRGHITEDIRREHDAKLRLALLEMGGLLDYLQSPEAAANAKRIKMARIARRRARTENPKPNQNPNQNQNPNPNRDPGTRN